MALVLAVLAIPAMRSNVCGAQNQVAPEFDAFIRTGQNTRVFLQAGVTQSPRYWGSGASKTATELDLGAHLDIALKPIHRQALLAPLLKWESEQELWVRLGYHYLTTLDSRDRAQERRIMVQFSRRLAISDKSSFLSRAGVDFRDKGGAHSTRYRLRMGLETEKTLFGRPSVPYVNVETLYDTRYDSWNTQYYQAGVEFVQSKQWRYELYYTLIEDKHSDPRRTNLFGLVFKYYH